eukprot:4782-Heterococcus_DN1.PRE.3
MPDVLTGITGTESALKLLQSGRCSQSQPLSTAAITVLHNIRKLSLIRQYYPAHLTQQQAITWPVFVPTCAAVDAYVIVASHLIKRSNKLEVLFPASVTSTESKAMIKEIDKHSSAALTISAYWSDQARHGGEKSSQLTVSIEQQLPKPTARQLVFNSANATASAATALVVVRNLAISGNAWMQGQCSSISQHVSRLALKQQLLPSGSEHTYNGISSGGFERLAGLTSLLDVSVSDNFLDLYKFAQTAVTEGRQQEFTLLIAILTYHNEQHAGLLHALMTVASYPGAFSAIVAPPYTSYSKPHEIIPARAAVRALFKAYAVSQDEFETDYLSTTKLHQFFYMAALSLKVDFNWHSISHHTRENIAIELDIPVYSFNRAVTSAVSSHYESEVAAELDMLVDAAMSQWPTRTVDLNEVHKLQKQHRKQTDKYSSDLARVTSGNSKLQASLNTLFAHHHCNLDLHNMLKAVDKRLLQLSITLPKLPSVSSALLKDTTSRQAKLAVRTVPSSFLQQPVTPHATAQLNTQSESSMMLLLKAKLIYMTGQTRTAEVTAATFAAAISAQTSADSNSSDSSSDSDNSSGDNSSDKDDFVVVIPSLPQLGLNASGTCKVAAAVHKDIKASWIAHHTDVQTAGSKALAISDYATHAELLNELLTTRKAELTTLGNTMWHHVQATLSPSSSDSAGNAIVAAGIWRTVTPTALLPLLLLQQDSTASSSDTIEILGAYAVLMTLQQRIERCLQLLSLQSYAALDAELSNRGHDNWSPAEVPSWLLLEVEGNYMTRSRQVDVARAMMKPEGDCNAAMQLNMGECFQCAQITSILIVEYILARTCLLDQ